MNYCLLSWGGSSASSDGSDGPTAFGNKIYSKGSEIFFYSEVNDDSINALIKEFNEVIYNHKKLNDTHFNAETKEAAPTVTLHIDSSGGLLHACFKFVDFVNIIRKNKKIRELHTIISGACCSAATIMAIIGDKRYMTPNAIAILHELHATNAGDYTKLSSYFGLLQHIHEQITSLYSERSGQSPPDIENLLRKESWFDASDYLKLGFIDSIF